MTAYLAWVENWGHLVDPDQVGKPTGAEYEKNAPQLQPEDAWAWNWYWAFYDGQGRALGAYQVMLSRLNLGEAEMELFIKKIALIDETVARIRERNAAKGEAAGEPGSEANRE